MTRLLRFQAHNERMKGGTIVANADETKKDGGFELRPQCVEKVWCANTQMKMLTPARRSSTSTVRMARNMIVGKTVVGSSRTVDFRWNTQI